MHPFDSTFFSIQKRYHNMYTLSLFIYLYFCTFILFFILFYFLFLFILWTCRTVWISFLYYSNHCMILCHFIKFNLNLPFCSHIQFQFTLSIAFHLFSIFSYFFPAYSSNILQSLWMRFTINIYQILSNICVYLYIAYYQRFHNCFFLIKIKWMVRIAYWKKCVNSRSIEIETETFSK